MRRVSVIGCPGAGKTEFSKQLASRTALPLIHLDRLYHDATVDYPSNRTAWRQRVRGLLPADHWLIDGNYKSTFNLRLPASDTVIFLDYPTRICLWRALKRRLHFHRRRRTDMPSSWREQFSWQFFCFILWFRRREAPRVRQLLAALPPGVQVITLTSPAQAQRFLTAQLSRS